MSKSTIAATERLYLTEDRKHVVRAGHPRAAFLYAGVGHQIPLSAVEQFGLDAKGVPIKDVPAKAPVAEGPDRKPRDRKSGEKGENKEAKKGEDKAPKPGITVKTAAKAES